LRTTSSNSTVQVASKSAPQSAPTSKSAALKLKSTVPLSPESTVPNSKSAVRPVPRSKSSAPQSKLTVPKSKSTVPKSKSSAPISKSKTAPQSRASAVSQPVASKQGDQVSDEESGVGGMLDEDDSQEQALAISSPLRGNEARAMVDCHLLSDRLNIS
jgi:hypothetical protein